MLVLSRFAGGGKMCYKLWRYCSRVIPPLMRLANLMHCIECGGDGYFIWIFPFFFACISLPSSSVFCLLVQLTCSTFPEERSLFGLLGESTSLSLLLGFSSMCRVRTDVWVGLSTSPDWAQGLYPILRPYPPTIIFVGKVLGWVKFLNN